MSSTLGHKHTGSVTQNQKAQLANAYNELGKELSSTKIKVIGNYTLGKVIGEGAYGKVRLGTHRLTSTRVAIKQIPKAMSASLTREIHHHRQLHHPHVTQMYEVIATESSIWIVTELCCGGELFDYLAEKGRLSEDETKIIFGQLCLAVAYLHEKGIVHRDLKLENVLLDEKCRVKLGDFGFTREFERGVLMETFCGTTGYASPEMLQGRKYLGPEVDVWSLGIILYCLLTGMLPFDDDDEAAMRDKIIKGDFEDPEWLSLESRDLIQNIIQKDPTKRLTISQILAHPWFTRPHLSYEQEETESPAVIVDSTQSSPIQTFHNHRNNVPDSQGSSEVSHSSVTSASTFQTASSDLDTSAPTTPDDLSSSHDPFDADLEDHADDVAVIHRKGSESTIKKLVGRHREERDYAHSKKGRSGKHPATVFEEDQDPIPTPETMTPRPPLRTESSHGSNSKMPPAPPTRTPARTKRRSVSSNLSDSTSPTAERFNPPVLSAQDFASLLKTPAPIIFTTPLERKLLNTLSTLGFDTAQIVHSVLSDACDASGAVWWMLKRKAERRISEESETPADVDSPETTKSSRREKDSKQSDSRGRRATIGVQTDALSMHLHALNLARSAPQLAFVPPTPTAATIPRATTPPRPRTPTRTPMLSPAPTSGESSSRSHPSTPAGSLKDKEGSKGRKNRSGSVSIMQRANTALEAVGLVRKKSTEAVRGDKDRDADRDREKSRETERRIGSDEEPRSSHGSGSSKLTKSPPLKPKDHTTPSTPPPSELHHPQPQVGSPWILAGSHDSPPYPHQAVVAPTPANSPGVGMSNGSAENVSQGKAVGSQRNRASLLSAFRLWFHEERKGKRKDSSQSSGNSRNVAYNRSVSAPGQPLATIGTIKRRSSGGGKVPSRISERRPQRQSMSSRRSSSVNSRRSSGTSVQMIVLDSPHHIVDQLPARRSFGSHTPNSERGEYSSRPSSVQSFSIPRHRKSPSASSAGSTHFRTASPSMQKFHRRAGSGSSTRVVRQTQATHSASARPVHVRSNSTASSIHSPASSRPASFYDLSESEGPRTASPLKSSSRKSFDETSRRSNHGSSSSSTTFVAQKRQGPFMSPINHSYSGSIGRSSWKKSWGLEPPGWQTRTTYIPVEVLAISPSVDSAGIRDVFSGRQSLSLGDESDWVDEDDDVPAFAGGLGQLPASLSSSSSTFAQHIPESSIVLSPVVPRSNRASNRTARNTGVSVPGGASGAGSRQKQGNSPVERTTATPLETAYEPSDSRGGRRQLPSGRPGPAFRHPIQEEDEGEEE